MRRLRLRGDRWPWYRTALWVAGMLLLFWVTNGPVNVYERFLFSTHMLGHMLLSMAIPVLLVLSAPITLGLRAIRKRDDGSRGAREWILLAVHSRVAAVLTHPLVAGGLFAASLWVFYYSPLFRWSTEDHVGHTWMVVHFLITGYLFAQTLVGIDPVAGRPPYPLRLLLLLATMAMHAFFGLSLVTGHGAAAVRLVRRDGAHLGAVAARRSAGGRRDRVERRRDPDRGAGDPGGDAVEPQRRAGREPRRPRGRPRRRRRARGLQRHAREASHVARRGSSVTDERGRRRW